MSASPSPRRRPEARPEEILTAALEEFGRRGLAGTRVADVAARAGVSNGTVYLYFPTKDDLFRAVVRAVVGRLHDALNRAAVGATAPERLRALLPVLWRALRSEPVSIVSRLVVGELHGFPDLARFYAEEVSGRSIAVVADVIREGVAQGDFHAPDPAVAARMLVALCAQHAAWRAHPELYPHVATASDEQTLDDVQRFVFAALRPAASPADLA